MKSIIVYLTLSIFSVASINSQTLTEAKELYLKGNYAEALPAIEKEYNAKPTDATLNQLYGACLFETTGDIYKAEECLVMASKKKIQDSFFYLGLLYTQQFRFTEAAEAFKTFESFPSKKEMSRYYPQLEDKKKIMTRLHRLVSNTEDIQVIDSLVVDKASFLSAYTMSRSSGHLDYLDNVLKSDKKIESVVYFNEVGSRIYYGKPDENNVFTLFMMERLLNDYGDEKKLASNNFGLVGDINYPFVMADGNTIYFAAKDEDSLGGYDLFVSRYNMNNDTFLAPERLSMPFNSSYNDYMLVIDEEKGIGWFASDRFQPEGKVCVYTFIPNKKVITLNSEDEHYLASRARLISIKDTWNPEKDYSSIIALARKKARVETKEDKDFEFVINDDYTYHWLNDFKDKEAKEKYKKVIVLKNEMGELLKKLEDKRLIYSQSVQETKVKMTSEIINMEKRAETLQNEIHQLEVFARNQEINSMK